MSFKYYFQTLLAAAALVTTLTGCLSEASSSVDQDRIFAEYELFYNANEDKTYARATFHFGNLAGTRLQLSDPSTITFNDEELDWNPVLAYYELAFAGKVNGTFVWTDTEGESFTNEASLPTFTYVTAPDTIVRSAATTLNWQQALAPHENVTVAINGENERDGQLFFTDNDDATSIILGKNQLEKVGAGPGTIYLDKRRLPQDLEATGAGAILTERYRPENLGVYFE